MELVFTYDECSMRVVRIIKYRSNEKRKEKKKWERNPPGRN